jgi:hypothetical protein
MNTSDIWKLGTILVNDVNVNNGVDDILSDLMRLVNEALSPPAINNSEVDNSEVDNILSNLMHDVDGALTTNKSSYDPNAQPFIPSTHVNLVLPPHPEFIPSWKKNLSTML